jgi:nucleotide-binding universal stress UspA family protein
MGLALRARDTARSVALEAGVEAEPLRDFGDPTSAVLSAADEHLVDVIVVGSSDRPWWRRLIEPSVANELLRDSSRPVLVVGAANQP